ncbi:MAG: collagen-like protein [Rhodospirillaceae bacterium]|nr:MAG: collagen-like protein [Rhodospirillaceae bacterium]
MTSINLVAVVKQLVALPVVVNRGPKGADGDPGEPGADGMNGWSPVFALIADGGRRVQQVIDWAGGTGAKPATGKYVGAAGLVDAIGDAVDIRGTAGADGDPGDPGPAGDDGEDGQPGADGADGVNGWSPVFAIAEDNDRRVLQVTDWTGGTGVKPATGKYVGVAGLVDAIGDAVDIRGATGDPGDPGQPGSDGDDGDDGWSPVFAVIADGDRRVQQVIDWAGGTGAKPATGKYVGVAGLVDAIGDAVDIRGATGDPGDPGQPGSDGDDGDDGWSPVFAVIADGDRRVQQVIDWAGGTGAKPAIGKYVGSAGFTSTIADAVDIRGPASAGGGSDPIADGIFFEDFMSTASSNIGPLGLATSQSGTGATVSNSNNANTIGSKLFETGTTNAGTAFVATGGASFSLGTNGAITFKCRLKLSALSDATDNYQLLIGFSDFVSSLSPFNGIYFRYNSAVSPNWLACSVRSTVETTVITGIPVTTAYQNLGFTLNEGATSIGFTVDGVPAATITTNIQTGSRAIVARINKIAGTTNRSMEIDYVYLERRFNFSRG